MVDEMAIKRTVIDNGIRIISERIPHVRSVSLGFIVNRGSRDESSRMNGICHFIEHMIFKGTAKRNTRQIAADIDAIGGHFDAFTSREFICIAIKVLDQNLPRAVEILADIILTPRFDEGDIERERAVILEEIKMIEDSPDQLIHDMLLNIVWQHHPLGAQIIGSIESVNRFSREDLIAFHQQSFIPSSIIIAAAGNIEHDTLVRLFNRHFGELNGAPSDNSRHKPAFNAGKLLKNKKLEQVHLCIATEGLPQNHPDRFIGYLYHTLLGGGMSSRLFQNIREKHGLSYSIFSYQVAVHDSGFSAVYAGCSPKNLEKVTRLTVKTLQELAIKRVGQRELSRTKSQLKGNLVLGLESTYNRMNALARQELYEEQFSSLDEILESIDRVSADHLIEFARWTLSQRSPAVVAIGPLKKSVLPEISFEV